MRHPDFFVVGAAKSGTTALWKYFQQHPDIFVTESIGQKELGYYSHQYGITDKEIYLNHFKEAKLEQRIGEVCHAYISSEESAEWIKKEAPNAKIIIILRNPIDRAYSLYNWMVMHGYERESSFEKALNREEKIITGEFNISELNHSFIKNYHYFNSGKYYEQVKSYFDHFGKENVLVVEYNDFQNNQKVELNKIFSFLEVDSLNFFELKKTNKSKKVRSIKVQYFSNKVLSSRYNKNPLISSFFKFVMRVNVFSKAPKEINTETRQNLEGMYLHNINLLSKLCEVNFNEKWLD